MSLGIGVIGAGVMGADHVRIIAGEVARAHVVAVCDANRARAETAAAETGARVIPDPFALIADAAVEAVVIASPDETHADYALACIAACKPVLCEKPLAPTQAEALRIVEAEQGGGRRLVQVGFMRRFDPSYEDIRARLVAGDLGAALLLHCVHRNAGAPPSFTAAMSITSAAVHEFDVARWLLGTEIKNIQVFKSGTRRSGAMHDPLLVLLQTDRGPLVDIEVFMNARYGYDIRTELVCERGTLTMAPPVDATIRRDGVQSFPFAADWRLRFAHAYRRQMQAFVDSIANGRPVGANAWDGLVATAIAEAGIAALASGRAETIALPERPGFYG